MCTLCLSISSAENDFLHLAQLTLALTVKTKNKTNTQSDIYAKHVDLFQSDDDLSPKPPRLHPPSVCT